MNKKKDKNNVISTKIIKQEINANFLFNIINKQVLYRSEKTFEYIYLLFG